MPKVVSGHDNRTDGVAACGRRKRNFPLARIGVGAAVKLLFVRQCKTVIPAECHGFLIAEAIK